MPKNNSPLRRQQRNLAATQRTAQAEADKINSLESAIYTFITLNPQLARSMVALHFNIDLRNPFNNWRKMALDRVWKDHLTNAQRR